MYLAKLSMDLRHPSIRQALKDRQDMHRNLAQAYETGFLYRLTESGSQQGLLVLSKREPDQAALEKRGYALQGIQDLSALPELYRDGAVLRFNLLAAPSKKASEGRENSRRVFLVDPAKRADWLKHQGSKYGFEVMEAHEPTAEQTIAVGRKSGSFLLTAIEFSGVLKIVDASLFWASWEKGIGPEKAYGLGLMLLSR